MIVKEFTGIWDPYEEPADADLVIDTTDVTPESAVHPDLAFIVQELHRDEQPLGGTPHSANELDACEGPMGGEADLRHVLQTAQLATRPMGAR